MNFLLHYTDLIALLNIALATGVLITRFSVRPRKKSSPDKNAIKRRKSFAFVTLSHNDSTEQLVKKIESSLSMAFNGPCDVELLSGYNSIDIVRQHVRIGLRQYHGVICSGVCSTQIAQETSTELRSKTPIVFINVKKEELQAISYKHPLPQVSGIVTERNANQELSYLKILSPSMKRVGVVYTTQINRWLIQEREELERACRHASLDVRSILITSSSDRMLSQETYNQLTECDTIIIMKNGLSSSQLEALIMFCETHNRILCADMEHIHGGIAINFDILHLQLAQEVARTMQEIFVRNIKKRYSLFSTVLEEPVLRINEEALRRQFPDYNQNLLFLLRNGSARNTIHQTKKVTA